MFRSKKILWLAVLALGLGLIVFTFVKMRRPSLSKQMQMAGRSVVSEGELSQIAQQYLKRHALMKSFKTDPAGVIEKLKQPGPLSEAADRVYTLVQAALAHALSLERQDPRAAADWCLFAAAQAYDALFQGAPRIYSSFDPRHDRMRLFYGRAVAGWIVNLRKLGRLQPETRAVLGETFRTSIKSGPRLADPNTYAELLIAAETDVSELRSRSMRRGIGAPFVGWNENRKASSQDRYFPLVGLAQALSAVALFSNTQEGSRKVELALYDSLAQETVEIDGAAIPLAADFTAAFAYQISKSRLQHFNLIHTLDIEAGLRATGFYMLQPFDPDKIPLITVHGLFSSPLNWVDVTNDLLGDAEIRANYQIWHFFYPPGLPILISASMFRDKIDELFRTFDPDHRNPKLDDVIVLAHSMGGLLTRTAVSESHDALWLKMFGKTERELSLPADIGAELNKLLNFRRREFIKRVIFVAVPHRGSRMSEELIGRIGRSLVNLPAQIVQNLNQLRSRLEKFIEPQSLTALVSPEQLNSIRGLSPDSPPIQALSRIAIDRGVKFHSIIGTESKTENGEPFDGVVTYSSAHLEGAVSELTVSCDHSAHTNPLVILEIERILRLHLREYETRKGKNGVKPLS
jgi:pimeloyl-ACP methyl ester carboxylesterase